MAAIDYGALFGSADYDPCVALNALRPAYMQAVVEGTVRETKFRDRTVVYGGTTVGDFAALIRQLEVDCAAKSGKSTRTAIQAGFRRA